jgi:predicted SAM-dependent methyltransferase
VPRPIELGGPAKKFESADYVAGERMIEHVPYEAGSQVISEEHRVLQRDGVMSISAPAADVIRLLRESEDPDVQDYIRCWCRTHGPA